MKIESIKITIKGKKLGEIGGLTFQRLPGHLADGGNGDSDTAYAKAVTATSASVGPAFGLTRISTELTSCAGCGLIHSSV